MSIYNSKFENTSDKSISNHFTRWSSKSLRSLTNWENKKNSKQKSHVRIIKGFLHKFNRLTNKNSNSCISELRRSWLSNRCLWQFIWYASKAFRTPRTLKNHIESIFVSSSFYFPNLSNEEPPPGEMV